MTNANVTISASSMPADFGDLRQFIYEAMCEIARRDEVCEPDATEFARVFNKGYEYVMNTHPEDREEADLPDTAKNCVNYPDHN